MQWYWPDVQLVINLSQIKTVIQTACFPFFYRCHYKVLKDFPCQPVSENPIHLDYSNPFHMETQRL